MEDQNRGIVGSDVIRPRRSAEVDGETEPLAETLALGNGEGAVDTMGTLGLGGE